MIASHGAERPAVHVVVSQHVEELAILWNVRRVLVDAGGVLPVQLARLDRRIAAHEDGCLIATKAGIARIRESLAEPDPSILFAASTVAIATGHASFFGECVSVVETLPETGKGLRAALGWGDGCNVDGFIESLIRAKSTSRRVLGLAGLRLQGVGSRRAFVVEGMGDPSPAVRAMSLRAVGEHGDLSRAQDVRDATEDSDPDCRFWGSWAAVQLGDRGRALSELIEIALAAGPHRGRALTLAMQAAPLREAHGGLQMRVRESEDSRWTIQAAGILGDASNIPWLLRCMSDDQTARVAGEAFSLITGIDLALLDLERKPPEHFESGPNDDPEDSNVDMDDDDGLPWPDPVKIHSWWSSNGSQFQPGRRYFMGAPVTWEHCLDVLKHGYQRQRILAAHYLCLLRPGTPLFNTSAPAWRQQRLLAQMH